MEPLARSSYEEQTGLIMQPLVLQAGDYSASLDGMTLEGDLLLEIKCPLRGTRSDLWQDVQGGLVPEHYALQVQHQLMVAGADLAHLWVFDGLKGILHAIERDEPVMQRIRAGWENFQQYLTSDTPPSLTDADTVLRQDDQWTKAAKAFTEAKRAADLADAGLAKARDELVALGMPSKGAGDGCHGDAVLEGRECGLQEDSGLAGAGSELVSGQGKGGGEGDCGRLILCRCE